MEKKNEKFLIITKSFILFNSGLTFTSPQVTWEIIMITVSSTIFSFYFWFSKNLFTRSNKYLYYKMKEEKILNNSMREFTSMIFSKLQYQNSQLIYNIISQVYYFFVQSIPFFITLYIYTGYDVRNEWRERNRNRNRKSLIWCYLFPTNKQYEFNIIDRILLLIHININ